MQGFSGKYYPKGWRFFQKTGGLTLLSRTIPELPSKTTDATERRIKKNVG